MANFFGDPEMGMQGDEWMRQMQQQQAAQQAAQAAQATQMPVGGSQQAPGAPTPPGDPQTPVAGQQSPYDSPSVNEASYWQKNLATQSAADRQKKMLAQMLMGQVMQPQQGNQTPLGTAAGLASKYMMMNAFNGMK